jgi:hypothetical protein
LSDSVVSYISSSLLLIDMTSSIYLNVWLKDTASFLLLFRNSFWTNFASYNYKNKSANKGAQFVPIGMPTDCWKTWSPKTTLILSTRKQNIPLLSTSKYVYGLSEWYMSHKICILFPNHQKFVFPDAIFVYKTIIYDLKKPWL